MSKESDFNIGGRLKARRLRVIHPPKTTTLNEHVRTERTERRRYAHDQLQPGETYEELVIEKQLRGEIASDWLGRTKLASDKTWRPRDASAIHSAAERIAAEVEPREVERLPSARSASVTFID